MVKENMKLFAPKISSRELWNLSAEKFNEWREVNDYPRIIAFLKQELDMFEQWMKEQNITDQFLMKHTPSRFLRAEKIFYFYTIFNAKNEVTELRTFTKYEIGEKINDHHTIKTRQDIILYPKWYKKKTKKASKKLMVNSSCGRSHWMNSNLELLDIGNITVSNIFLSERKLDFLSIDDLKINRCWNNQYLELWFCSALNLTIIGNFAFIDGYATKFSEFFGEKSTTLNLHDGKFQSWSFEDCSLNLSANNAIIHFWIFIGWDFNATISNTDIRECEFKNMKVRYPIDIGRIREFHERIKELYSQIGKRSEASKHFYLEKSFERKSFLYFKANHQMKIRHRGKTMPFQILKIQFLLKYFYSGLLNLLWGYGEKPGRVIWLSLITIFLFSLPYYLFHNALPETKESFGNSLYYSAVTFTTLGYGVNQTIWRKCSAVGSSLVSISPGGL